MIRTVNFEGVKATVQNFRLTTLTVIFTALFLMLLSGCDGTAATNKTTAGGPVDPNETAATVNGKAIKLEEVERVIKQEGQGQEAKLSPLELADARLRVLESLIQQEVMFQKAEKEGTVPKDEDVTAEFNRTKQQAGLSQEKFDEEMKKAGQTEASAREVIKRRIAIKNLIDKISSKVEPPKDSEIEAFFNGNKEAYIKRKGVKLAAIVVDPANNGEGDPTTDEPSAVLKGNEIIKQLQQGADFATLAREKSEDPNSRIQGGDLGYISEEQLKQSFPAQVAATLMNPQFKIGQILPTPMQGKFYVFKLQERSDKDEEQTLETPGVRQDATNRLIESRKQLLAASYQTIAMNEAKIENNLAKRVVENPNELSGARPAGAANANVSTNANSNVPTNANAVANTNAAATNANAKAANSAVNTTTNKGNTVTNAGR
jgi:parvulin-like peptidyl-prolyl isomerase